VWSENVYFFAYHYTPAVAAGLFLASV